MRRLARRSTLPDRRPRRLQGSGGQLGPRGRHGSRATSDAAVTRWRSACARPPALARYWELGVLKFWRNHRWEAAPQSRHTENGDHVECALECILELLTPPRCSGASRSGLDYTGEYLLDLERDAPGDPGTASGARHRTCQTSRPASRPGCAGWSARGPCLGLKGRCPHRHRPLRGPPRHRCFSVTVKRVACACLAELVSDSRSTARRWSATGWGPSCRPSDGGRTLRGRCRGRQPADRQCDHAWRSPPPMALSPSSRWWCESH